MSEQDSTPRTTDSSDNLMEKSLTGSAYVYTSKLETSDQTAESVVDADNDE